MANESGLTGSKTCARCNGNVHVLANVCPRCGDQGTLVASIPADELSAVLGTQAEARSLVVQSKLFMQQGRFSEAEKLLRRAQEINPHNAVAFGNMGGVYFLQEQFIDAISWFEKALALDPTLEGTSGYLATARQKVAQGQCPEASASCVKPEVAPGALIVFGPAPTQFKSEIAVRSTTAGVSVLIAENSAELHRSTMILGPGRLLTPCCIMFCHFIPLRDNLRSTERQSQDYANLFIGLVKGVIIDNAKEHTNWDCDWTGDISNSLMTPMFKWKQLNPGVCVQLATLIEDAFNVATTVKKRAAADPVFARTLPGRETEKP